MKSNRSIISRPAYVIVRAVLCTYLVASIPLRLAFIPKYEVNFMSSFTALDFISTVFFICDILQDYLILDSRIIPVTLEDWIEDQSDNNVTRKGQPKNRGWWNLRWQFLVSAVSVVPFEYATLFRSSWSVHANYLLLNKCVRLILLPVYIRDVSMFLEARESINYIGAHRAWKLFFAMALAGHFCSCGFFWVAKKEALEGETITWPEDLGLFRVSAESTASQISHDHLEMTVSVFEAYIQALYWAYITMITTGFGDIVPLSIPETLWCILTMCIGVVITTCAIANLQLLVTNMDAALTKFEGKMETLGKYMRYRNIPNALQNRILSFYHYQWKLLKGADEEQLLRELPQSLQQQVANFMCRDLIASLPVLRKANIALLNALADSAEINIFSPNDDILKPGEPMKGTILISRGDVEVLHQGRIERKMKRFDSFGEESLFSKIVCDKNVRGKTFCEIFLLPREDFQEIIHAQCDHSHIIQMKETALTITKNATKANKLFGTAEDGIPTHGFRKYCHPDSRFRRIWNFVTLIGYLFYIFSLPLHVMKFLGGNSFRDDLILFIAGYMFDAFFAVNFYLQRNCFMYLEEGLIVFQQDQIVQNFDCAHNIKKEVLALSPFDALSIVDELRSCCHLFRLIKIFRVLDVVKCFDVLDKIGGNHIAFRVIKLNFSLLIVCHWVGCLWHGCASLGDTLGFPSNWRQVDEEDLSLSIDHSDMMGFAAYLRSVYWAIVGMSTVGYGDIVPTNVLETTYTTVIILFGGLVLPAIVGGLAAYLGSLNLDVVSHEKKLLLAKTYMRNSDVDKDLVDKVMNFYDYLWSRQGTIDEETIMNELPGSLRQRVAMFVNSIHIEAVPFLSLSDDSTKELLLSLLKPRVFMPNDFAVHKGELGTNMYFITKGSMVVLSEDQKILFSFLQSGDHFGESALLHTVATEYSVKAITYCDCFILNKDDFLEVTNGYLPQNEQKKLIMAISTTMYENMERNKNISTNINTRRKCQRLLLASGSLFSEESISGQSFSHSSGTLVPFRPESKFRACWNFVIVCICTYNAWVVPFRLAFKTNIILYYVDWALDCFLIIDMLLNYSQFAFVNEGELVNDTRRVRRQYMKRYFRLDFITTFPYDAIAFVATTSRQEISMAILRIPKLLKIRKVPLILGDIYHVLQDARVNLAPLRLIEFLSGVILVAHWAACGFYALARWKNDMKKCTGLNNDVDNVVEWATSFTECKWNHTWIKRQIIDNKLSIDGGTTFQRYIRAFNWGLPTLVVVVIGDVVPVNSSETLYAFVWMLVGVTINAAIIGNVANLISNVDSESSHFIKKVDDIKMFMHRTSVTQELQNRINLFLTYLFEHRDRLLENDFIEELPVSLKIQITEKHRQRHLRNCPFFDFCSNEIVRALSLRMRLYLFSKDDILVHVGDQGQDMFFLDRGSVEVLSESGTTVFATLTASRSEKNQSIFFGETSLFFKKERTNTIRAKTFCEVYELKKYDLDKELRQRDFDLSRMLDIFTAIAKSNERRNKAVSSNMELSKLPNEKLSKLIGPHESINPHEKKVRKMFLPNSTFRICWDITCALVTTYVAIDIPFKAVFYLEDLSLELPSWLIVGFLFDSFFIIDLYFRHFIFQLNQNGSVLTKRDSIEKERSKNFIIYDVISCLPVELLSIQSGVMNILHYRLLHVIRIIRLPFYFMQVEGYLNIWGIRMGVATRLVLKMFFCYFLVIHWCGSLWFAIHRFLEPNVKYTWATTDCPGNDQYSSEGCLAEWSDLEGAHNVCNSANIRRCYIRSIYFVLTTLSTVGYGDISPVTEIETIFENIVVLIGACFMAGIIGAFAEYLSHNDESGSSAFKNKMKKLKEYMHYRHLPVQLQEEILYFHQHNWNKTHLLDERTVLSLLSLPLQLELSFEIFEDLTNLFPVLQECNTIVQKRLCHAFMRQTCIKNATIYSVGEIGWDIYFVTSGLVQVTLPSDEDDRLDEEGRANIPLIREKAMSLGLLYRPGNHFGESALVSHSGVRQETVTSHSVTELLFISKESLDEIFKLMPSRERNKLKSSLLSRNGNVWHRFDRIEENDHQTPVTEMSSSSFRSSSKSFLSWSKPDRFTMVQTQQSSRRLALHSRGSKRSRLRSFSADASVQAIRIGRSTNSFDTKKLVSSALNVRNRINMGTIKCAFGESEESEISKSSNVWDPGAT